METAQGRTASAEHEARWLNTLGVAGIVLEYRHSGTGHHHPAPIQDAQRALRTVRARADRWKLKPNRIGILGFSAGGHLASTAGFLDDAWFNRTCWPISMRA